MSRAYVIAGASLAGAKAAETLREQGFDGPVVLIGDETERPYERPPLSKDFLLGQAEAWYAEHGVDLRLGARVDGIDPAAHEVRLADGSQIGYAKLLLATVSLAWPGRAGDGGGATIQGARTGCSPDRDRRVPGLASTAIRRARLAIC